MSRYPALLVAQRLHSVSPYFLHNLTASAANGQRLPSSLVIENPRQHTLLFNRRMPCREFPINANDYPATGTYTSQRQLFKRPHQLIILPQRARLSENLELPATGDRSVAKSVGDPARQKK